MSDDKRRAESPGTWLGEIEGHLWAMDPRALGTLCQLAAEGRLESHLRADIDIEAVRERGRPKAISGGVVTVPLKGVIAPVGGLLGMLFDIPDPLQVFRDGIRQAMADPEVGAIVLDIDSPGGVVDGIPEAAAELRALRGTKPIIAHSNGMTASAAYWLAAQADEIVMTPSGAVGSIGVYATHREMSGMMEMMGVKNTLISAGKFKTEGNPFEPLSDEARAHIQEDVDHFYGLFISDVAKGRGVPAADVRGGYGEGRVLNAKAATAAGLVDRVDTLDDTVARLLSRQRGSLVAPRAEAEAGAQLEAQAEADAGADEHEVEEVEEQDPETETIALTDDERATYRSLVVDLTLDRLHDNVQA